MKNSLLLGALLLWLLPHDVRAADDTAHHRAVYAEINGKEGSMKKKTVTFQDPEDDLTWELNGWFDGQTLRKIVARVPGEDGDGSEEIYVEDGKPLFVFRSYRSLNPDTGKPGASVEDRMYFKNGKLFKWLGNDKQPIEPGMHDFSLEADRQSTNFAKFTAALSGTAKPKAAAALQTMEGTFLGIEEGDYAHWMMRTKDGGETSFFVLRPDASVEKVLESPDKYKGKKCRIQWKSSMENLPEAGGKTKVEQILSVEWPTK
jgi:hypothetical protein